MDGFQSPDNEAQHSDDQTDVARDPDDPEKMTSSGRADVNDVVFDCDVDATPSTLRSTLRQRTASREEANVVNGTEPYGAHPDVSHRRSGSVAAAASADPVTDQRDAARGAAERSNFPLPSGIVRGIHEQQGELTKAFRISNDSSFGRLARQLSNINKHRIRNVKDRENRAKKPKHYFDLALVTACCFVSPLGIVAIVMSVLSNSNQKAGNHQRAVVYRKLALTFSILGIISTIFIAITLIMLYRYPWNEISRP